MRLCQAKPEETSSRACELEVEDDDREIFPFGWFCFLLGIMGFSFPLIASYAESCMASYSCSGI